MVVLVDHGTASAAEIVAGALQENHRAPVLGTQTFGTGTVLQQFDLSDGSAILLGVQEWLTPNGQFLRNKGITPTMVVALPANGQIVTAQEENEQHMNEAAILASNDTQLIAGIQQLTK
jgi:carboxyl-terminal processing protease